MSRPDDDRRVVEGFRLPSQQPISKNELDWIEFLRLVSRDTDPPIMLARIQALRALLEKVYD
jgi:hypothetical protein